MSDLKKGELNPMYGKAKSPEFWLCKVVKLRGELKSYVW
jgi:NUMOD3 motif